MSRTTRIFCSRTAGRRTATTQPSLVLRSSGASLRRGRRGRFSLL
jgi:hypothetical protein